MSSESDLLRWIIERQRNAADERLLCPAGDDLAIAAWNSADLLVVGVDQVLDGVHFDSAIHSPRDIGSKAMNRNLSDCAAMACLPAYALISAALPHGAGIDVARELYLGIEAAGAKFDSAIIGGDTGSWPGKLAVSVTIIGRSAGVEPIRRSGAKVGDALFVTGALGGSILGRHMTFEPRVQLARELAQTGRVHAMIDLSDGLSRDLPRLCEASGVGAIVDSERVPIHADAVALSRDDLRSELDHAMNDGEDYELLFAADPSLKFPGIVQIGEIVARDLLLRSKDGSVRPISQDGWEHSI